MNKKDNLLPQPQLVGLKPSFGFGDRIGLATFGHVSASRKGDLVPMFAQQSVREMERTNRTPMEVMLSACGGQLMFQH